MAAPDIPSRLAGAAFDVRRPQLAATHLESSMRQCYAIHFDGHCVARANIMLATNELVELWVDQSFRREGLGRRLLKLVCNEADREGVVLKLMAAGSEDAMSTKQLEAWYGRFGFVSNPSCMMVRKPRTKL